MYNIKWLAVVAQRGLADLVPAIRQAFNHNPDDDRLDLVYGARPRRNIILITIAGLVMGPVISAVAPMLPAGNTINWSAVVLAAAFALLIRRYLFDSEQANETDFPWLAASTAPAIFLLMAGTFFQSLSTTPEDPQTATWLGTTLIALTAALGVAAAFTISLAALCFSRKWANALVKLAVQLIVFRIMVFITTLIMLEIGVIGPIVKAILGSIFSFRLPQWVAQLLDQISYAGLIGIVYLAVIGATWTVCRERFGTLLVEGDVNIVETVALMAKDPAQVEKKEAKKRAKAEAKALKKARKESKK